MSNITIGDFMSWKILQDQLFFTNMEEGGKVVKEFVMPNKWNEVY